LKPNMFAQVAIHTEGSGSVVVVPREAVIRTGKMDRVVLALDDGRFKSIEVVLGQVGEDFVEIREGLKEGEKVVTSAQFLIDSESSISSDFKRMEPRSASAMNMSTKSKEESTMGNTAEVDGVIVSVMADHRMLTINRGPIPKWNRDAATLNFWVADGVDMSSLKEGMSIRFTFVVNDGELTVTEIQQ